MTMPDENHKDKTPRVDRLVVCVVPSEAGRHAAKMLRALDAQFEAQELDRAHPVLEIHALPIERAEMPLIKDSRPYWRRFEKRHR